MEVMLHQRDTHLELIENAVFVFRFEIAAVIRAAIFSLTHGNELIKFRVSRGQCLRATDKAKELLVPARDGTGQKKCKHEYRPDFHATTPNTVKRSALPGGC